MAVIRRVRLQILSKEDLHELENNVVQLESLAKRKEAAKSQMSKVRARRGTTRSRSGGIFGGNEEGRGLPRNLTRKMDKADLDRLSQSVIDNVNKNKDKTSALPLQKPKELMTRIQKLEQGLDDTTSKVNEVVRDVNDPIGLMIRSLSKNANVARLFAVTAVITVVTAISLKAAKIWFGPGGGGDVRKVYKDETASVEQLQLLVDISQGKTFYSSDLRVFSHIVDNSSTESMGARDQLYKEINIGSDING